MKGQSPILTTKDLTVGYKQKGSDNTILENVNVSLHSGELVCFMGPNGVGKSTLIRTITGIQKPLSGHVFIDGDLLHDIDIADLSKKLSVVLTDKINAANLTVYELIALGRYPYLRWNISFSVHDKQAIEGAIETTKIGYLANRKIYELSDGQLQKVMIARALCQDTPIMILDEPTAHLDLNNRVEVINLLRDLAKKHNKSILMATHELDLALQSADRIWLTGADQPIVNGFPEDLVLNGAIDKVFQLKGFDLKTGRLEIKKGDKKVKLIGEGHDFLWTKNALERNGFCIAGSADITIEIQNDQTTKWLIKKEGEHIMHTLEELINFLS